MIDVASIQATSVGVMVKERDPDVSVGKLTAKTELTELVPWVISDVAPSGKPFVVSQYGLRLKLTLCGSHSMRVGENSAVSEPEPSVPVMVALSIMKTLMSGSVLAP